MIRRMTGADGTVLAYGAAIIVLCVLIAFLTRG
jgi:hypothetical protein